MLIWVNNPFSEGPGTVCCQFLLIDSPAPNHAQLVLVFTLLGAVQLSAISCSLPQCGSGSCSLPQCGSGSCSLPQCGSGSCSLPQCGSRSCSFSQCGSGSCSLPQCGSGSCSLPQCGFGSCSLPQCGSGSTSGLCLHTRRKNVTLFLYGTVPTVSVSVKSISLCKFHDARIRIDIANAEPDPGETSLCSIADSCEFGSGTPFFRSSNKCIGRVRYRFKMKAGKTCTRVQMVVHYRY